MSNFTTMGESYPPLEYNDPIFEYLANATKTKGNHTIRFGTDISRQHINHIETNNNVFTFTGRRTSLNGGPSANQYNQIADFLLGLPQSVTNSSQIQQPFLTLRTWEFALYVRDQWQATRKLTVNYGVRWEHYPVPRQASKGISIYNPSTDIVQECGVGGAPSDCGIKVSSRLFAPSVGLAYRLTDSFVLRAGFSLSPLQNNMSSDGLMGFPDEVNVSLLGRQFLFSLRQHKQRHPGDCPARSHEWSDTCTGGNGQSFYGSAELHTRLCRILQSVGSEGVEGRLGFADRLRGDARCP